MTRAVSSCACCASTQAKLAHFCEDILDEDPKDAMVRLGSSVHSPGVKTGLDKIGLDNPPVCSTSARILGYSAVVKASCTLGMASLGRPRVQQHHETAGFSPCLHLPGFHFGSLFVIRHKFCWKSGHPVGSFSIPCSRHSYEKCLRAVHHGAVSLSRLKRGWGERALGALGLWYHFEGFL